MLQAGLFQDGFFTDQAH